jgi:TPR repeat protein
LLLAACQTTPPDYSVLAARATAGDAVDAAAMQRAFVESPDYPDRMERLRELEQQAYAILEDEPLKLGSLGAAIIDTYYGSLTGHYVLARFYRHLDNDLAARPHEVWIDSIRAAMHRGGGATEAGNREQPLLAITAIDAQVYAVTEGLLPIGMMYQTSEDIPFLLTIQAAPDEGPLQTLYFDLSSVYAGMRFELGVPADDLDFTPLTLIGYLARQGDTAAQAAVGAFLASQGRVEDAVNWLRAASRSGNLLANSLLARIFWEQARQADDDELREQILEEVLENYLHAIALGSPDAMYALGVLYLNGHFGADNVVAGLPLLQQAAEQAHGDATLFLAHLHYVGEAVERDYASAREWYARAAAAGNPYARRSYARFLLDRDTEQDGDPQALAWLTQLAAAGDAEAMLLLGNLTARGLGTPQSHRGAIAWFKRAVRTAPTEANIVNEVAWTLTVSDQLALRRARYARGIMDRLMTTNAEARQRPEYLDTWAATYAATGNFERAVLLQEEALAAAAAGDFGDVEEILQKHLEFFRSRQTLYEVIP